MKVLTKTIYNCYKNKFKTKKNKLSKRKIYIKKAFKIIQIYKKKIKKFNFNLIKWSLRKQV